MNPRMTHRALFATLVAVSAAALVMPSAFATMIAQDPSAPAAPDVRQLNAAARSLVRATGASCTVDPASTAAQAAGLVHFTTDPNAGTWRTWWVDAASLLPPAPPATASRETVNELAELHQYQLNRTDEQVAKAQSFDDGAATKYWTEQMLQLIVIHAAKDAGKNPPRLALQFAELETGMFDALVATWNAKYCYQRLPPHALDPTLQPVLADRNEPSYPSEHAAIAGLISVIMPAFFPANEEPAGFDGRAHEYANARVLGGANYRSDVDAGYAIGQAVGHAVLAARANDHSSDVFTGPVPTGDCLWIPTPPAFKPVPVEPLWGTVTPFLMTSGSQFRVPPPPNCHSVDFLAQTRDLYEVSKSLTPRQMAIARYWAGAAGTVTPPGMWLNLALNETIRHDLSTMRTSRVMATTAAALADAGIACWDTKFTYNYERPVTTIRREIDPTWKSFIPTPPFPGYISGHSTFAGASTGTLAHFFPEEKVALGALASEAAESRYYGGIHIRSDNEQGLVVGGHIAELAVARAMGDGGE